jgi:hypothetical protein
MSAALRNALFWLLIAMVPLQGIAAKVMLLQGPEQGTLLMQRSSSLRGAITMDASGGLQPCASMVVGSDPRQSHAMLQCRLSAVCGLVAAPALQFPAFLHPAESERPRSAFLQLQVAFPTGAPERPPRLVV